jgi:hypothetical protein
MGQVVIGMDRHKRSATIEVMAGDETVLAGGRSLTDAVGCRPCSPRRGSGRTGDGLSRDARASAVARCRFRHAMQPRTSKQASGRATILPG